MSADRYTIEIDGERVSVFVGLVRVICQRLDVYTVGAIRQQARDLEQLRWDLGADLAYNKKKGCYEYTGKPFVLPAQWLTERESKKLSAAKITQIKDEIGDAMIFLLNLSDKLGIDILAAAADKLDKNRLKYPVQKAKGSAVKYTEYNT